MNSLISVIVPVYNVEKYLNECVDSLISQTYSNLEIILVDDGSTDSSFSICMKYKSKDSRIVVYHKDNEGLGLTRNYGLQKANGEFVTFLDSDDYLYPDAIKVMYEHIKKFDCDIVSANTVYKDEPMKICVDEGLYDHNKIMTVLMPRIMGNYPGVNDGYTYTATAKLYKKSTLMDLNILFPSERKLIWEDLVFSIDLFPKCNGIYVLNYPAYYYRYTETSLTHKYIPDKFSKVIVLYQYVKEKIELLSLSEDAYLRLAYNFLGHIRTCIKLEVYYSKNNGKKIALANIRNICKNEVTRFIYSVIPKNTFNKSQYILSIFMKNNWSLGVYFLTWLQIKKSKGNIN